MYIKLYLLNTINQFLFATTLYRDLQEINWLVAIKITLKIIILEAFEDWFGAENSRNHKAGSCGRRENFSNANNSWYIIHCSKVI